jgi:hypothetical protein
MRIVLAFLLIVSIGWGRQIPYNSVDCDNAKGNPKLCTVEADEDAWEPVPDSEVKRIIARVLGKRYHQRCSNGGGVEPDHDGFRECTDTFINKKTGMPCKVNPQMQNEFICIQKSKSRQ